MNALVPSNNDDLITADEVQSAAVELKKTTESIVSDGLAESDPLVAAAQKLSANLSDVNIKVRATHALFWEAIMYGETLMQLHATAID